LCFIGPFPTISEREPTVHIRKRGFHGFVRTAFYWRKKPEFHRRLSLVATCSLTAAAFGRFPTNLIPHYWFYAGVDSLILLGVFRDLHITKRIHSVYLYALPLLALAQTAIIHVFVTSWQPWIRIARMLLA
jgi:hypothetical protein